MLTQPTTKPVYTYAHVFVSVCVDPDNDPGFTYRITACHGYLPMLDGIGSNRPESGQDCEGGPMARLL